MSVANQIKIRVIDEDEEERKKKSASKSKTKKNVENKKEVKKTIAKKKTVEKKKTVSKKESVKKTAKKKTTATKNTKETTTKKKSELEVDPDKVDKLDFEKALKKELADAVDSEDNIDVEDAKEVVKEKAEEELGTLDLRDENAIKNEEATHKSVYVKNLIHEKDIDDDTDDGLSESNIEVKSSEDEKTIESKIESQSSVKDLITDSIKEEEEKQTENLVSKSVSGKRSIKLYRRIAGFFVFLVIVLLSVIAYFSYVRVSIVLIPNQERVSNNMIFDVKDIDKGISEDSGVIKGIVKQIEIEHEGTYKASGKEIIGKETIGTVTIINDTTKAQPLIATTRLLSSDGKLFRIKETVISPAGGNIEVAVYADEPSAEMAIGPTRFSIPGLWAGLQDKIYAESKTDMVFQQKLKMHITQDDIDNSLRLLKQELLAKAKEEVVAKYSEYGQTNYDIDEGSIISEVEAEAGEEKEDFSASMKGKIIVVAFDEDLAAQLAEQKLISSLSENKELLSFDETKIVYTLNSYDYEQGSATINANFEGKVSLKENSEIVGRDEILGLNDDELKTYLNSKSELAGFEVKYYPAFKKNLKFIEPSKIRIEIKK